MDHKTTQTSPGNDALRRAIKFFGTQALLARSIACSQQYVSWVLRGEGKLSAEAAVAIDRATSGVIQKHELRPDLFEAPAPMEATS
jgi:DNA-binding transcriptional regulator YdaS (Cro superfamily)